MKRERRRARETLRAIRARRLRTIMRVEINRQIHEIIERRRLREEARR